MGVVDGRIDIYGGGGMVSFTDSDVVVTFESAKLEYESSVICVTAKDCGIEQGLAIQTDGSWIAEVDRSPDLEE